MCLRRSDAERTPIAGAQLRFYFSPLSPEQKPDTSFMIGSDGKFWRRHRSLSCPYCQAENPPREAFDTILSEHEAPPRRDSNAGPQKEMDVTPHIEDEYIGFDTGSDETWARIMSWLQLCHRTTPTAQSRAIRVTMPMRWHIRPGCWISPPSKTHGVRSSWQHRPMRAPRART